MKNFSNLSLTEIEAIDGKAAVEAIEKAIRAKIGEGTWWNAFNGPASRGVTAYIGDVRLDFGTDLSEQSVFDAAIDGSTVEEIEAWSNDERSEIELTVASSIVEEHLDQGLAKDLWQSLTEQAERTAWRQSEDELNEDLRAIRQAA